MKYYSLLFVIFILSCTQAKKEDNLNNNEAIPVIRISQEAISGIGLKPVTNKSQPNRRLFQKKLIGGTDLSVYVVSSETATAQQSNYGMEEFIKLVNGRSRMNPENGDEVIFESGDSFIAPKGFTGEWETIGGDEFLIELSIISTQRIDGENSNLETLPYLIDRKARSGVKDTTATIDTNSELVTKLYEGIELTVEHKRISPKTIEITKPMQEQVVEILSGKVTITPKGRDPEIFLSGDYFMIPKDFIGKFQYEGHGDVRTMNIYKSVNKDN